MPIRLHNVTSLVSPIANTSSICSRCARKIARLTHGPARTYQTGGKLWQGAVGAIKEDDIHRRFFWANPSLTKREKEGPQSILPNLALSVGRTVPWSESLAATASPETSRPGRFEERGHRRRKCLKAEAVAALVPAGVLGSRARISHTSTDLAGIPPQELPPDASSTLAQDAAAAPPRSLRRAVSSYLALSKPRLAFLIVLTTTASYSIYPVPALLSTSVTSAPSLSTLTLLFLTSGTFLAIASANTLNMLFEPQHDAKMSRTRNRPLVRGLVSKRSAMLFAVITGLSGTLLLWYGVHPTTALLGAGNIILYAFVYTPLKRVHPVNTWIGAIVGAIPPLMGWCAAGSQYIISDAGTNLISSPSISILSESADLLFTPSASGGWLLAALLFAWQFPHFFALSYGVRHEYAHAGYKMLTSKNIPMAARVSLRYSIAMFPICAALSWYEVTDPSFAVLSCGINGWMVREAWRMWRWNGEKGSARALFWASVWQLPIVLVLGMVLKKGLWARLRSGLFGDEIDEHALSMEDE